MTIPERLAEMKARCDAATPGPWTYTNCNAYGSINQLNTPYKQMEIGGFTVRELRHRDAKFIAHARTDILALIAALEVALTALDDWAGNPTKYGTTRIARDEIARALEDSK